MPGQNVAVVSTGYSSASSNWGDLLSSESPQFCAEAEWRCCRSYTGSQVQPGILGYDLETKLSCFGLLKLFRCTSNPSVLSELQFRFGLSRRYHGFESEAVQTLDALQRVIDQLNAPAK